MKWHEGYRSFVSPLAAIRNCNVVFAKIQYVLPGQMPSTFFIGLRGGYIKGVVEVALIFRPPQNIGGFKTIKETEIPQLQAHCEKLTETGRSANCRTFINKLIQLLNSLTLWASSDGTSSNMTAEQRAREARYLQKGLQALENVSSRSPNPMYK